MQIIKSFFNLIAFVLPVTAIAQSTYLNQGAKEYHFIDRLEIKQQRNTDLNFSSIKPFSRKYIIQEAEFIDSVSKGYFDSSQNSGAWRNPELSRVDKYNMHSLMLNNSEWVTGSKDDLNSRIPVLKTFYKSPSNFFEVNSKDFFLAINPVLQLNVGNESDNDKTL